MEWIIVIVVGAVIGWFTSLLLRGTDLSGTFIISLAILGALMGSLLYSVTRTPIFGPGSRYVLAVLLAFCFLVGGVFTFTLTKTEKRE